MHCDSRTIFATQIRTFCPPILASQVLHVPSWQLYLIGTPVPRAMSLSDWPGTTVDVFVLPLGPFQVTDFFPFCLERPGRQSESTHQSIECECALDQAACSSMQPRE